MLETVSTGFKAARNKLKGRTESTTEAGDEALRDIRVSLLEADVSFEVVKRFVARVREKAVGEVVDTKVKTSRGVVRVTPQDQFVKICHDELEALMGPVDTSLRDAPRGRPTGVDQLKVLGEQLGVPVFHAPGVKPPELCRQALEVAQKAKAAVVIYDT